MKVWSFLRIARVDCILPNRILLYAGLIMLSRILSSMKSALFLTIARGKIGRCVLCVTARSHGIMFS